MSEKTASAALRIFTPKSDLNFLSEALLVSPTEIHLVDTPISAHNPTGPKHAESLWIYESPIESHRCLSDHIEAVIEPIESNTQGFRTVKDGISSVQVFCMFSSENGQGSIEISPHLLGRLAALKVEIIIDLYLA